MGWMVAALSGGCLLLATAPASAQDDQLIVVVVDPGPTRLNPTALGRAIADATSREVVRMTDERAPSAGGRLTIAFSAPDRWVLRYEARGQVAWVSDRIQRPGTLRARLAELSQNVVARVEGGVSPAARDADRGTPPRAPARRSSWNDDVILALQDEIVDPFADSPRPRRREPISILWSEVVDPFADRPPRADIRHVVSEVLDPWAGDTRRRR